MKREFIGVTMLILGSFIIIIIIIIITLLLEEYGSNCRKHTWLVCRLLEIPLYVLGSKDPLGDIFFCYFC